MCRELYPLGKCDSVAIEYFLNFVAMNYKKFKKLSFSSTFLDVPNALKKEAVAGVHLVC
jgi:hypothetical protein